MFNMNYSFKILRIFVFMFVVCCFSAANAQTKKAAFLSTFSSFTSLQSNGDDDEIAAADWLLNTYGGDFLSVSSILSVDLSQYNVIWLAIERDNGFSNFPVTLTNPTVLSKIKTFYQNGGNLLLTNYAVKYLYELGRANNDFGEIYEGPVDYNEDTWGLIPVFGRWFTAAHGPNNVYAIDRSDDPLYRGLTYEIRFINEGQEFAEYTYTFYPLIGPGPKEIHRVAWNGGVSDYNFSLPSNITEFETRFNMEALGTFEFNEYYRYITIGRWLKHNNFNGKAITISEWSYEWNQNNTINPYQANIQRLTKNALDELGGNSSSYLIKNEVNKDKCDNTVKTEIYNINGKLLQNADLETMQKGIYILIETCSNGNIYTKKIVK